MSDEEIFSVFSDLSSIQTDPPAVSRSVCQKCRRPSVSCWCSYLPPQPLSVKTTVYILQHPFEESRNLQTAQMIVHGLEEGRCSIIKGKKFSLKRMPELDEVVGHPKTLLLFPGPKAIDMSKFMEEERNNGCSGPYNLIVLDGTWNQARSIYYNNEFLHSLRQVQLNNTGLSKYVIRTQPTDSGLSTVETVAVAVGLLEEQPHIFQALTRPLDALCEDQLRHGAVRHHSKQYLIDNGLYVKPQTHLIAPKKRAEKLLREQNIPPSATPQETDLGDTGFTPTSKNVVDTGVTPTSKNVVDTGVTPTSKNVVDESVDKTDR